MIIFAIDSENSITEFDELPVGVNPKESFCIVKDFTKLTAGLCWRSAIRQPKVGKELHGP